MTRPRPHGFWTRAGLVVVPLVLTAVGILFVHSTKAAADEGFPGLWARRQALRALAAALLAGGLLFFNYLTFKRWAYAFYAGLIAILVCLLVTRSGAGVARRWIAPGFSLQPSELMKIGTILCLARYLCFRSDQRRLAGLLVPYGLTFLPMALVLLQPDLGTSLMLPPILLGMLLAAGARPRHVAITALVGISAVPAAYFLGDRAPFLREYQHRRIVAYFEQNNPDLRQNETYQLVRSEIAIGSGGLWGMGWHQGVQNRLGYLPAKHTDFIFSIIAEEWGFAGASVVVLLFVLLVFLCFRVALRTREPFGRLVAAGTGVAFAAQSFENVAMTMGLTPITGLPLPFVSYGGSSLLTSYLALGLVLAIASRPVAVVASRDLDPRERRRPVPVLEPYPGGALARRWPT